MTETSSVASIPTSRPCLGEQELAALSGVLDSRWLGTGALTRRFEEELAAWLGVRNVVAVNSGTAALHVALEALGLESGDEVIVPSLTFVSTVQAILAAGARPVFCDVRIHDAQFDTEDVARRLTPRTRAILPVHYGGACGDMDGLLSLAEEKGLPVVEDAAHAFGSKYKGHMVGTLGKATCFSFDPIKNITCGSGGAVATDDDELASTAYRISNAGMQEDSWTRLRSRSRGELSIGGHGYRYRMVDLNASIGLSQLPRAKAFCDRKRAIVRRYDEAFAALGGLRLLERDLDDVFPFHYALRVLNGRQGDLAEHLRGAGIGTTVHFTPNHLHSVFSRYGGSLPATERLHRELLTLPLYVEMTEQDVDRVIYEVNGFIEASEVNRAAP